MVRLAYRIEDEDMSFGGLGIGRKETYNEVPPAQQLPRPVILWGILGATVASLRDSFEAAKHQVDLDKIRITPAFPVGQEAFPAIQVSVASFTVEQAGFHPSAIFANFQDPEREAVLVSRGTIVLDIYTANPMKTVSIQDFITQICLLNIMFGESFYYSGSDRDYVNMTFQPGKISWSRISHKENTTNPNDPLWTSSGSFGFLAEHHAHYSLKRLEGVDITAIPLELTAYLD